MDLVVILLKHQLDEIMGDKNELGKSLGEASKILNQLKDSSEIHVQITEGNLPNMPLSTEVLILISSAETANNLGRLIVEFKTEAISIFSSHGIQLDKKSLEVRLNASYDIDKFLKIVERGGNKAVQSENTNTNEEFDYEQKSKQYIPVEPAYSFNRVILPHDVLEKIEEAISILECESKVFDEWGLYEIQPHPSTSLSFYGPSGTGKTMAAEAIAHKLGKKILKVSYADVESKYHGEGPKMVKAIFLAAENNDAVLFFDEADSLLSKRLTNVSQGSEQAINSMRSQLLICLEEFRGIVIFATNLVVNYDQAFLTRLISVEFKNPDSETRKTIWDVHVRPLNDGKEHKLNIPLAYDVDTQELANNYDFAGREIRNAVVSACVSVAMEKRDVVSQADFVKACDKIAEEKRALAQAQDHTKSADIIKKAIQERLKKEGNVENVSEQSE